MVDQRSPRATGQDPRGDAGAITPKATERGPPPGPGPGCWHTPFHIHPQGPLMTELARTSAHARRRFEVRAPRSDTSRTAGTGTI